MKLQVQISGSGRGASPGNGRAFTLPELMIAITVFTLLVGGIVFSNLYGLRMFQLTQTKLSATDNARKTIGRIADEIRTCNSSSILNVDTNGSFTGLLDGEIQQGNSLQIYPTTNINVYTLYFVNSADETLRRTAVTLSGTNTTILAESITNAVVFRAQDYLGNVLTNNLNNHVTHLNLEFYQPQSYTRISDYYKIETSVIRRALE